MASWIYLPILKWKLGERIALRNLREDQREGLVPLLGSETTSRTSADPHS
jgi:hypothetical protein